VFGKGRHLHVPLIDGALKLNEVPVPVLDDGGVPVAVGEPAGVRTPPLEEADIAPDPPVPPARVDNCAKPTDAGLDRKTE
jgi:hypothetical protein